MSKSLEEKLGVNLEEAAVEAHALFFQYMNEFDKISSSKAVSKKDLLRSMKQGFYSGLIDAEVKLRSNEEVWLSNIITELIKCSIVMHGKMIKDNESSSESSEQQLTSTLNIGRTEGV